MTHRLLLLILALGASADAATRVPDKTVVLTFDDSVVSHATFVAPLLKKYGFGATFFITEGFKFLDDKKHYLTWQQIKGLHDAGFEIGNHTRRHAAVPRQTPEQLDADIAHIEQQCAKHGIPRPVSFCYPGYRTNAAALKVLAQRGYQFARAGGARAADPQSDHPLLLPQAFDGKPASTLAQFKAAVAKARDGKVAIMTFHGVPDIKHPWVNTDPAKFESYLQHLKDEDCKVVALRDLARPTTRRASTRPPNFIVLLCDNLGYGDVGCYGSTKHRTPNIDRMAREGMRFTSFYSTSGVCTPSRASLMTGCYPRRVGLHVDPTGNPVMIAVSQRGLHTDEITVAEVLKQRGYTTKIIGKWHLGDQPPFLPTRHGFDSWFGIPYSDDMGTRPPVRNQPARPPLPLMRDEVVVETEPDRNRLTKRYTEEAIKFLKANRARPFFLYLPHAMPGSTRAPFASDRFRGQSANGPWGDSVEELDWSTGQILAAVKELKLEENTLVIWTNDNGAPRRNPTQGLNLPLAGWGYNTSEGAHRVPCIMRWPGRIPAGQTCDELATMMDLLPTFARLAGTRPPPDRTIDGHDIWPLITGERDARSPYEAFYYYYLEQLQAVRLGKWKLHLPLEQKWINFRRHSRPFKAELFDLTADLSETTNLALTEPDIVRKLMGYAEQARADLGDFDRLGNDQRPAGFVANPTPRLLGERTR